MTDINIDKSADTYFPLNSIRTPRSFRLPVSVKTTLPSLFSPLQYNDGDLISCFDKNIPESVVKEIAKRKPLRAVFRDSSFADSPSKINVFEIFKLYMPEDANDISKRVRVI